MAVDRQKRDAAAETLAAFLRGETDRDAFTKKLRLLVLANKYHKSETDPDAYLNGLGGWWRYFAVHEPISAELWMALRRHLAFLRSDLEERRFDPPAARSDDRPREILLARWHAVGLLVAAGVSYFVGWWLVIAANVLSYVSYMASVSRHDRMADAELREHLRLHRAHEPFADTDEWLAHEDLVTALGLPAYDARAFADPPRLSRGVFLLMLPIWTVCWVVIAAAIIYMYAFSIAAWPLWLVAMAVSRREATPQQLPGRADSPP